MERKTKASLSRNLLFSFRKGRNFEETRRVQACSFFLEYTFVSKMNKKLSDVQLRLIFDSFPHQINAECCFTACFISHLRNKFAFGE